MKSKLLLTLALVLGGGFVVGAGLPASREVDTAIPLPIKFAGYHQLYTFIAQNAGGGLPTNDDTVFKLAADSTTSIITLGDKKVPYVYLIESHYYNGGVYDRIRGAQGNGDYFIVRPLATNFAGLDTDKGFELIGMAAGNNCTFTKANGKLQFVPHWHLSANQSPEIIYQWNGKIFERVK